MGGQDMTSNEKMIIRIYPRKTSLIKQLALYPVFLLIALLVSMCLSDSKERAIFFVAVGLLFAVSLLFLIYSFFLGSNAPLCMDEEKVYQKRGMKKVVWYWKDMQNVYVGRTDFLAIPSVMNPVRMVITSLKNQKVVVFEPTARNLRIVLLVCTNEKIRNQITNYENNGFLLF
jgi:hypothetical protein